MRMRPHAYIACAYIFGGPGYGIDLQWDQTATDHRNAFDRHCSGALCIEFFEQHHSGDLRRAAENGAGDHIDQSGPFADLQALRKVGRPANLMSFLPACFEIGAVILFAPIFLGISRMEAAVMGAVLSAVSPAIVVPRMVDMIEKECSTKKGIPQMILAGASLDDIFVIVLFTTVVSMAQGGEVKVASFLNIPISIILGIALGAVIGYGLTVFFETNYALRHTVRNSMKTIILK